MYYVVVPLLLSSPSRLTWTGHIKDTASRAQSVPAFVFIFSPTITNTVATLDAPRESKQLQNSGVLLHVESSSLGMPLYDMRQMGVRSINRLFR